MALHDIVAYQYAADVYCPSCIIEVTEGPPDGILYAETWLDHLALMLGVDRQDEASYDSGEFPKVVFRDQLEPPEFCGNCLGEIRR